MKILHYSLGFPPYRSGGMTKYCIDLMLKQIGDGHTVGLLWPGEIVPFKKHRIKKHHSYKGIESYEIINPLPVPLDEGIKNPMSFIKQGDLAVYDEFLEKQSPDVIHIHTFMGLHKEFVDVAKKRGIKTIFTSHDYFGICPKVTLFCDGEACVNDNNYHNCVQCNANGLTETKMAVIQSAAYRKAKNFKIVKILRKKHRASFFEEKQDFNTSVLDGNVLEKKSKEYMILRNFYFSIFSEIDKVHFNSTVAKEVYSKYFKLNNYIIRPVTHLDVSDHRKIKDYSDKKLRITYLGPTKIFKGFNLLKTSLDKLWEDSYNFELRIFNVINTISPYIIMKNGYSYNELESIFENTDVLVAPSLWCETFGFTVLEALSYGVPVIISSKVGAKDIVCNKYGIILRDETVGELYRTLKDILNQREILKEINLRIVNDLNIPMLDNYLEIYNVEGKPNS